jgi:hypothetical protein
MRKNAQGSGRCTDPGVCSELSRHPSRGGPSYYEGPGGALTSKRQTGAPAVSAPVCHHSREPVGDTTAGAIWVPLPRYPMMVGWLQTKQQRAALGTDRGQSGDGRLRSFVRIKLSMRFISRRAAPRETAPLCTDAVQKPRSGRRLRLPRFSWWIQVGHDEDERPRRAQPLAYRQPTWGQARKFHGSARRADSPIRRLGGRGNVSPSAGKREIACGSAFMAL